MHTIVITGGHHNSALVVAKELISRGHKIVWIGHRHAARGDTADSAEYIEVVAAKIPFHDLNAAKLLPSLAELTRFPLGILKSVQLLVRIKPTAILSFGGYLGGTVALAGKALGIPIYLHEQTVTAGRANKLIGRLAEKVYLTWADSAKYFAPRKIEVVGLPLRESILSSKPKELFTRHKPTLLVMGGKLGSHAINNFIFQNLQGLLTHYNIIHQTGTSSLTNDYDHSLSLQNGLASLSDCYLPVGYISEDQIGGYLTSADLYLGRSGAHICYELAVLRIKSILIPLMSTHDGEQRKNATILVTSNLAQIISQSHLTLKQFMDSAQILKQLQPSSIELPRNASKILVDHLLSELK